MSEFCITDLSEREFEENAAFARGIYLAETANGGEFTGKYSKDALGRVTAGYGMECIYGAFEYSLNVDQETGMISELTTKEI